MFSKIKNIGWKQYRQDWLNLNTTLAVIIYAISAWGSITIIRLGTEKVNLGNEFTVILVWLVTLFPALLIIFVFGAYRGAYKGQMEIERSGVKILAWRRYALPMTILMSITTFFLAAFLYEDLANSEGLIDRGQFAFGTFEFPIYYGDTRIEIPSTIFWFAFLGYLITLTGVMLRRIVTNNLVPHFYLASSFRLIKSLLAAVLIVMALNGVPEIFPSSQIFQGYESKINLTLNPYYNILIAFVAGATADDIVGWIIYKVRKSIGRGEGESLSLSTIQGIDPTLEAYLHEEGIDSIQILATTPRKKIVAATNIADETIEDWQVQAEFLRNLESPEIATKFHRLGINELSDLDDLDVVKLSKALTSAGNKNYLENEEVFEVLINVLKNESKSKAG